jgi:hypothetical protein
LSEENSNNCCFQSNQLHSPQLRLFPFVLIKTFNLPSSPEELQNYYSLNPSPDLINN